jgi:hypothetical protein
VSPTEIQRIRTSTKFVGPLHTRVRQHFFVRYEVVDLIVLQSSHIVLEIHQQGCSSNEERTHDHENQSSCGHVPRHRPNSPPCYTSRCVTSHRYPVVLLLSFSWHRGSPDGVESRGRSLHVPGCLHSNLTVWKEEQFTVLPGQGVKQREKWVVEWVTKVLSLAKSGVWGYVQTRTQWSTEEDVHRRPGHHWLCEFGDTGNNTSCVKQFNLCVGGLYLGTHVSTKENVLSSSNGDSTEWRWMRQDSRSKSGLRTLTHHGQLWLYWSTPTNYVSLAKQTFFFDPKKFALSVDDDTEWRSRREWIIPFFTLKYSIFPINLFRKKNWGGGVSPTTPDYEVENSV